MIRWSPLIFAIVLFGWHSLADEIHLRYPRTEKDAKGVTKEIRSIKCRVDPANLTPDEVNFTVGKNSDRISTGEVSGISWDREPGEFEAIRTDLANGDYAGAWSALEAYGKKNPEGAFQSDPVKQQYDYWRASIPAQLILQGSSDFTPTDSAKKLLAFINANRNYYRVYEAYETLGSLSLLIEGTNKLDNAKRFYGELAKSAAKDQQFRARLLLARAQLGEKQYDDALKLLTPLAAEMSDNVVLNSLVNQAKVAQAAALAGKGQVSDALKLLEQVVVETPDNDGETQARANLALGNAYYAAGAKLDALMAFLKVDLLYYAYPELRAEALAKLEKVWLEIPIAKADRAADARQRLQTLYPNSRWNRGAVPAATRQAAQK